MHGCRHAHRPARIHARAQMTRVSCVQHGNGAHPHCGVGVAVAAPDRSTGPALGQRTGQGLLPLTSLADASKQLHEDLYVARPGVRIIPAKGRAVVFW